MPFVRIDLLQGKPEAYRKALGEIVYQAMRETLNVPPDDKFQVITEHPPDGFNIAESYLGNRYSPDIVLIQVTLNVGRTVEQKQAFYRRVAAGMAEKLGARKDDVVINLVEVSKDCWSFGGGVAQYVT
jgi:4-oxalocrotonate tautomerase